MSSNYSYGKYEANDGMKKNKKKEEKKSKQKDFDFFKYCMKYANCKLCPLNGKGRCKDELQSKNVR